MTVVRPVLDAVVNLTPASAIHPEPVTWAWNQRIPLGAVTVLAGDPGLGKSTLTMALAAQLSRGDLPGDLRGTPVTVALATVEDAVAHVVVPRLHAAGADMDRVHIITVQHDGNSGGLTLPSDLPALKAQLETAKARVVIVDPLVAHLPSHVNSRSDQDVRRVLAPLAQLAEQLDAAVIAVMHLNKNILDTRPLTRIGGSIGFVGAARSVLLLGPDPDDREGPMRVLAHEKSNYGAKAPALRLRVEGRTVTADAGAAITTQGIVWCGEALGLSAADLLVQESPEERTALGRAKEAILELLAHGPVLAKTVEEELTRQGIKPRTWKRAKSALVVESRKLASGEWEWIPPDGYHPCEGSPPQNVAPLAPFEPTDGGRPSGSIEGCQEGQPSGSSERGALRDGIAPPAPLCMSPEMTPDRA
jgi:archaellum biogenesis ATPase FlaH